MCEMMGGGISCIIILQRDEREGISLALMTPLCKIQISKFRALRRHVGYDTNLGRGSSARLVWLSTLY